MIPSVRYQLFARQDYFIEGKINVIMEALVFTGDLLFKEDVLVLDIDVDSALSGQDENYLFQAFKLIARQILNQYPV